MATGENFKARYRAGDTPWDAGEPDFNLIEVVTESPIRSCKALEVGCGTGDNSIWLARNRFQVIGTDVSDVAVEKAKEKADLAKVECDFLLSDFLKERVEGSPFGFVFDRGCFHSFDSEVDRRTFAQNVAVHLAEAGLWLSLVGNADEDIQGPGPPRRSARDIVNAVEPYFEILTLKSGRFGSDRANPPRAWQCLMQKRDT